MKEGQFYSALQHQLLQLRQARAPKDEWPAIIRGLSSKGVKKEEIEHSGVLEYIAQLPDGPVERMTVVSYLVDNPLVLNERIRGELMDLGWRAVPSSGKENADPELYDVVDTAGSVMMTGEAREAESFIRRSREQYTKMLNAVHYKQHCIPGGEDYRELLIMMDVPTRPKPADMRPDDDADPDLLSEWVALHERKRLAEPSANIEQMVEINRAIADCYQRMSEQAIKQDRIRYTDHFVSQHYDDLNIIVHARYNIRSLPEGRKMLFIEEIQSDLHQLGRRWGYYTGRLYNRTDLRAKAVADGFVVVAPSGVSSATLPAGVALTGGGHFDSAEEAITAIVSGRMDPLLSMRGPRDRVPNAPFKTSWHELAVKRLIQIAAEAGCDLLGWTTGDQQIERYRFSKALSKLTWEQSAQGFRIEATRKFGHREQLPGLPEVIPVEDLDHHLGKGLATKLLELAIAGDKTGCLEGEGLVVGGDGLKHFYDSTLPAAVSKLMKPHAGIVGKIDLGIEDGHWILDLEGDHLAGPFSTSDLAQRYIGEHEIDQFEMAPPFGPVWGVSIRNSVKATAEAGFPLFMKKEFEGVATLPTSTYVLDNEPKPEIAQLHSAVARESGEPLAIGTLQSITFTGETLGLIQAAERVFNKTIVGFTHQSQSLNSVHGVTIEGVPNTIFLNAESPLPVHAIIGHELVHTMRQDTPDLYQRLNKILMPVLERTPRYQTWSALGDVSDSERRAFEEELIADHVSERLGSTSFWANIEHKDAGLHDRMAKRTASMIRSLGRAVSSRVGLYKSHYAEQLHELDRTIVAIMDAYALRQTPRPAPTVTRAPSGPGYG